MDIKQKDLKILWKWCGLVEQETGSWYEDKIGGYYSVKMPTLTLDHLYKFAIPKLQKEGYAVDLTAFEHSGFRATIINMIVFKANHLEASADTPTEALYNAILKVIDNEVK
jgi:hypothetical protein